MRYINFYTLSFFIFMVSSILAFVTNDIKMFGLCLFIISISLFSSPFETDGLKEILKPLFNIRTTEDLIMEEISVFETTLEVAHLYNYHDTKKLKELSELIAIFFVIKKDHMESFIKGDLELKEHRDNKRFIFNMELIREKHQEVREGFIS